MDTNTNQEGSFAEMVEFLSFVSIVFFMIYETTNRLLPSTKPKRKRYLNVELDKSVYDSSLKKKEGDAGYDLCATHDVILKPGKRTFVSLGIKTEYPNDVVGLLFSRSGLSCKHGILLANGAGVIDASFRHEWKACFLNTTDEEFEITKGMRVCQAVFMSLTEVTPRTVESIEQNSRGKGFGSSGFF